jgi:hypothetical protein
MCPAPVSRSFSGPWVPWSLGPRLPKFADYFRPPAHTDSMIDARTQIRSLAHSLPYSLGPGACPEPTRRISMSRFNLSGIRPVHDLRLTTHDLRLAIHGPRSTAPRFTSSLALLLPCSPVLAFPFPCSLAPCLSDPRTLTPDPCYYPTPPCRTDPPPYPFLGPTPHAVL